MKDAYSMSFSISFLDEPLVFEFEDPTTPAALGRITIGDCDETFVSSLYRWSKEEYEVQWLHAIKSVLSGCEKAALIVEYLGPEAGRLRWWPMYRIGNIVYLREQILFFDQLQEPFSLENAFSFVHDREEFDEDGNRLSEWAADLSEVEEFVRLLRT
jgi:hypothetical protein